MDYVLIDVYQQFVRQHKASLDHILEDPELRNRFLAEVRQLVGNLPEYELLHRLTYLRKQKKLPRSRDIVAA